MSDVKLGDWLSSRPARGAWVEIRLERIICYALWSRPARGAWVEIQTMDFDKKIRDRRAPQGARGLKLILQRIYKMLLLSRPARGAWVEMRKVVAK